MTSLDRKKFIYPYSPYHGDFTPEQLLFNANLQEFAQKAAYLAGLHTGGKISSGQAYEQLANLWKQLEQNPPKTSED